MTDEKYTFIQDCKEKKRTARGAFNKRTHCGKGGAIMFPSDYLTNKEKKAMNGEVISYRMNDPMKWEEFKSMPSDLQRSYILALRNTYHAPDSEIAKMLGVSHPAMSNCVKALGINLGRGKRSGKFNKEAWERWINGLPTAPAEDTSLELAEEVKEYIEYDVAMTKAAVEAIEDLPKEVDYVRIPRYNNEPETVLLNGRIMLTGMSTDIMKRVVDIIGHKNVEMTIHWSITEEQ